MKVIQNYITNFEFCEGKNLKHFIYKAKQLMVNQKKLKKSLQILEDGASSYIDHGFV